MNDPYESFSDMERYCIGAPPREPTHYDQEDEVTFLRRQLALLHQRYMAEAQPYLARLVAIESTRPAAPIIVTAEMLSQAGINVDQMLTAPAPQIEDFVLNPAPVAPTPD